MSMIRKYNNPYYGLVDPFFGDFFNEGRNSHVNSIMKTDIVDKDDHYEMKIEMPEVKKEDIHLSLENGYLTIEASVNSEKKESQKKDKYVLNERYYGSFKRSFEVGDNINESDISAKLENGVLAINIAKKDPTKEETKKYISIE